MVLKKTPPRQPSPQEISKMSVREIADLIRQTRDALWPGGGGGEDIPGLSGWEHPRVQGELEQTVLRIYPETKKRNSATLWNQIRADRALLRPMWEVLGYGKHSCQDIRLKHLNERKSIRPPIPDRVYDQSACSVV